MRDGSLVLISSPVLLAELERMIHRAKFDPILARSTTSRDRSLAELWQLAEIVEPAPLPQPVCCDPDDDAVLALALAARRDLIVSGNDDLLTLGQFQTIPIVAPALALQLAGK